MKDNQILGKSGPRPYFRHFSVPDPVQKNPVITFETLKKGFAVVAVFALLFTSGMPSLFNVAQAATTTGPYAGQTLDLNFPVPICHANNNDKKPYIEESPDVKSIIKKSGHGEHTGPVWNDTLKADKEKWGDIIPPFTYLPEAKKDEVVEPVDFPGLNWDDDGIAIYEEDCATEADEDPCEINPEDPACNPDPCDEVTTNAVANPCDPCELNPQSEGCEDPCELNPRDPECGDLVVTIDATKIVCPTEDDLPNWSAGADITATTASTFIANNPQCHLEDWDFQWGFGDKDAQQGVDMTTGDWIGEAAAGGASTGLCPEPWCGANTATGAGYDQWKTFNTSNPAEISDLNGASSIWVREVLKPGYYPFSAPVANTALDADNVSAEIYCGNDVLNYDNFDFIQGVELGEEYHCVAFNAPKGAIIKATKIVCDSETLLPNWGTVDSAIAVDANTATDFLASTPARTAGCHLEDWDFQWGYGDRTNEEGVDMLPGDFLGAADGTPSTNLCPAPWCGVNTFSGANYNNWKSFDSDVTNDGITSVVVPVLEGVNTIWVREELQENYVPFSAPVQNVAMNSNNVSAEMYCHNDVFNYDNYDFIANPVQGETYYCIAINAEVEKDDGGNGGEDTPNTNTSRGGSSRRTPSDDDGEVLGDVTTTPSTPQVAGATDTLPRTGTPTWAIIILVLMAVPAVGYKALKVKTV